MARTVGWAAIVLVGALNGAGYVFNLWSTVPWYDNVLHAFTSAGVTLLIGVYLAPIVVVSSPAGSILLVLLIASVGVALGAMWEVGEWIFDQLYTRGSAIPGKTDTIIDLVLDTIGAVSAAAVALVLTGRADDG